MYKGNKGRGGIKEIIDCYETLMFKKLLYTTIVKNKHVNWLQHLKMIIT